MREAVRALVTARVLDVRRGDGTYVTSLRPELLLAGIGAAAELLQDGFTLELVAGPADPRAGGHRDGPWRVSPIKHWMNLLCAYIGCLRPRRMTSWFGMTKSSIAW